MVKTYFFCFHVRIKQSVCFFLGQENANLSLKSVLKEVQGQLVVVGRVGRKTKEEGCDFVTHLPGPWVSVLLPRTALCLSSVISFFRIPGSFLHCGMSSRGASCCLAGAEY